MRFPLALLLLASTSLLGCAGNRCGRPCPPPCPSPCEPAPPPPARTPPPPAPRPVLRSFYVGDLVTPARSIDDLAAAARSHLPSDAIVSAQGQTHLIAKSDHKALAALDAWLTSERKAAGLPPPPDGPPPAPAPAPVRPAYPIEAEALRLVYYDVADLVGTDAEGRTALLVGLQSVVPAIQSLEMVNNVVIARGTSGEQRAIAAWLAARRQAAAAPK